MDIGQNDITNYIEYNDIHNFMHKIEQNAFKTHQNTTQRINSIDLICHGIFQHQTEFNTEDLNCLKSEPYFIHFYIAMCAFTRPKYLMQAISLKRYLEQNDIIADAELSSQNMAIQKLNNAAKLVHHNYTFYKQYFTMFNSVSYSELIKMLIEDNVDSFKKLLENKHKLIKISFKSIYSEKEISISFTALVILFEASNIFQYIIENRNDQSEFLNITEQDFQIGLFSINKIISHLSQKNMSASIQNIPTNFEFLVFENAQKNNSYNISIEKILPWLIRMNSFLILLKIEQSIYIKNISSCIYCSIKYNNHMTLEMFATQLNLIKAAKELKMNLPALARKSKNKYIEKMIFDIIKKDNKPITSDFKIGQKKVAITYKMREINFKKGMKNAYRLVTIDDSKIFTIDEVISFLAELPFPFTFKQNRITSKGYYGILYYEDMRVFRIKSIDHFSKFTIEMCSMPDCFCIKFDENSHQHIFYFSDDICVLYKSSCAKKFCGRPMISAFLHNFINEDVFMRYHSKYDNGKDIINIIKELPGHFEAAFTDNEDCSLYLDNQRVEWLCWVPPSTKQILKKCQIIQLDATFSFQPYILIVPHAIINNIGYPIAVFLGPTEDHAAYDLVYQTIINSGLVTKDELMSKKIMIDFGTGIAKFASLHPEINIYYCLRHYLGRLNPKSPIYGMAQLILWSQDSKSYSNRYNKYIIDCKEAFDNGELNKAQFDAFVEMKTKRKHLALYERDPMVSCNNHIESFHGRLRDLFRKFNCKNLKSKFRILVEFVIKRINSIQTPSKRNVLSYFNSLAAYSNLLPENKKTEEQYCSKCKANNYFEKMQNMYGIYIPCIHNAWKFDAKMFEDIPGINIDTLEMQEKNPPFYFERPQSYNEINMNADSQEYEENPSKDDRKEIRHNIIENLMFTKTQKELLYIFRKTFGIRRTSDAFYIFHEIYKNHNEFKSIDLYRKTDSETIFHSIISDWRINFHEIKKKSAQIIASLNAGN